MSPGPTSAISVGGSMPATRPARHRRLPRQPREGRRRPGPAELQRGLSLRRTDGPAVTDARWCSSSAASCWNHLPIARALPAWRPSVAATRPLVIVHGGGRAIDAELAPARDRATEGGWPARHRCRHARRRGVACWRASANTELVAALVAPGVPAVGLTGVDAGLGRAVRTSAHRTTSGAVGRSGLRRRSGRCRPGARRAAARRAGTCRSSPDSASTRDGARPQRQCRRHGLPHCGARWPGASW